MRQRWLSLGMIAVSATATALAQAPRPTFEVASIKSRCDQFSEGGCALSTRIVLNVPLPGTTRNPHCSLIAVLSDGASGSGGNT